MKQIAIWLVRTYSVVVSPYTLPRCRFQPTCSEYTLGALQRHGFLRGTLLAAWRILRCHPWGGFGFDPVP